MPDSDSLMSLSTETLKAKLLDLVRDRDEDPISQKVRFVNDQLSPIFEELQRRNPTPDVSEQISLVQEIWLSVWSTIPFQDILPGRLRDQSYQVFADNGYYANLARYKPGHQTPLLNWFVRQLLSYDLMIVQTYAIGISDEPDSSATQTWNIQNVGIKQNLRFGATVLSPKEAQTWFEQAVTQYQNQYQTQGQDEIPIPSKNVSRAMAKKYQKVYKSQPQLEHLYIDANFRLVKSRREQSQRPSYTIAVRNL
ncbi:MAG: hypothetical protein HC825_01035 [Oscillatoriales cyanobacterium RM1_1_9]|nr:hypothetical protein [Oscillatoriales cyanobacterium SM2_3_0]NJO45658.1 hypothetical protein [Oscillatoriales cyanobacterium RM2_1_1]NJO70671.1 hypothetical protein [Oscillatoriales cyanobacterium RM1_1_9]